MNTFNLLRELRANGVKIFLERENIRIGAAKGKISQQQLELLKQNKSELISLLKEEQRLLAEQKNIQTLTVSDFPLATVTSSQLSAWQEKYEIEDIYAATSMQAGMIFHSLKDKGASLYVNQLWCRLDKSIDLDDMKLAWEFLLQQHSIFRTAFVGQESQLQQLVCKSSDIPWSNYDHTHLSEAEHELQFQQFLENDQLVEFDFEHPPLLRVATFNLADGSHRMVWTYHHALVDGWCSNLVLQGLIENYKTIQQGKSPRKVALESDYKRYIHWLSKQDHKETSSYWRNKLQPLNHLVLLADQDQGGAPRFNACKINLSERLTEQLNQCCRNQSITLNSLVMGAWALLVHKESNSNIISFGATVAGRPATLRNVEKTIGLFINSIPVVSQFTGEGSLVDWCKSIQDYLVQSNEHSYYPLTEIQKQAPINGKLFESLVVFENYLVEKNDSDETPFVQDVGHKNQTSQPLALVVLPAVSLGFHLGYQQQLFSDKKAKHLLDELQSILEVFAHSEPKASISQMLNSLGVANRETVTVLEGRDREEVLHRWNDTQLDYPKDLLLHQLFESQVSKSPDRVALTFKGSSLTYAELNDKANQAAKLLRRNYFEKYSHDMPAETLVGLYFERGFEMVVGILACLKAGATYVPISPDFPPARTQYIVDDTNTSFILSQSSLIPKLDIELSDMINGPDLIELDLVMSSADESIAPFVSDASSCNLAYVIYTSGTTGNPKGVMIEHCNAVHLVYAQQLAFHASECQRSLLFASYTFDASVSELFIGLSNGHEVFICSDEDREADNLRKLIQNNNIDLATIPPALLQIMAEQGGLALKVLVSAGETPAKGVLETFRKNSCVINAYGPTESTVCASTHKYQCEGDDALIGLPIRNVLLYVLDEQLQPVPNGTQGELYIGGAGLARGYLNRAELTAERFIDNPFVDDAARALGYTRLYKTGDVVRRREDGNIEYLGRNDFQVKIRGYRIELGEIEAVLCEETSVRQAAVIDRARDDGSVYLVAYVVMQEGQTCDSTHLVSQLGAKLPEYMIPSHIVTLSALPLTLNGKLDRRALPAPEIDSEEFVAPRNETEQALCQVWQDVLGLAQVGIEDNFFRLGGDSIVCIQLVSRLRQAGYVCQVKDIFNAPTVAQLSCLLADNMLNGVAQVEAEQGELVGTFDLLPIQQWFFDKALPAPHHWNQAFMVRLPSTVSPQALQAGLEALVARHDMLRCRFIDNKQQYYGMDEVNTELLTLDVSNLDEAQLHQQLTAFQSEFDYQFGPSWCAVHLTGYDDGSARLFMALHHLIVDAVSWRILVDDLSMIMQGHTLPDKTSSYRQWVHALKALEPDTEEIRYWQGVMATPCSLPTAEETIMVDVLQQSSEVTAHLLRDTNEGFNTEINDVLLSAMVLALSETLGEQAYTLGLEGHGREPMDETLDLSRTIGWFTTLYPVRLLGQETVADTLIATKETLRQVPNKGLGFGALRNKGELGGALPTIMFNYLGQFGDGSGQVEDWSLVGEDVGMTSAAGNEDSVLLSVTGAIYEGRLRFKVVSRLSELVHHNFNEAFTSALAAVVAAGCAQAKLGGRKTPSDYGVPTLSAARLQYLQKTHDIEALYPASSLQQGFIYYHLNEPDDDAYRVQVLLDYHCALNIAHYRQAWQMASLRFPSLRVCFDWQDTLVQIVTSGVSLTDEHFSVVDISQLASDVQEQEIERLQQEARMIGFDLSRPGLVRLTIVKRSDTLYTVIKTEHHSISDGWSGPVLGQAVHEYYEALQAGLTCEIKPDQAYLNAQAYQMSRQAQSEAFWQAQKQQYGEANDLRGLFDSSVELADSHLNTAPKEQALELTGNALAQLKNMCRESGTTVNVALQFAWHYLLHGYTQDNQTLVGTTVSGRDLPIEGIESSVGLYINTLPLSVSWDEQQSVEGVLQSIQQSIAMLNSHSAISLAKLQEGGHRLFHSLVVFENYPRTALEGAEGIINQVHFRKSVEKMDYPLTLRAFERDESLVMALCYNGDWLSNKQATRLLSQVMRILTQLPQVERLSQLCLLDEQERTATLLEGNDTQATYPIHGTLVSEFERQVLASPEHIALEMGGVQLSYQQLDAQANQLARELRDRYQQRHRQAMPANTLIGLYMDRSVEMMVAVLAVLKAGGAYVPISPEFPAERTAFILKDTGCPFVLTHAAGTEALQGGLAEQECAAEWLAVEQVMKHTVASDTALPLKAGPEDLAYVIYTSGTTGQPKGVMIAHRAIVNRINWMQKRYPLSSEDKVLQKTPYIFDVSVWELFWAHWAGASLVMAAPDVHRQPEALHTLIEEAGVTTLHFVPSMLAAFCAEMSSEGKVLPRSVKQVFSSGEALQVSHVDAFYGLGQHDAVLHNLYGPTEASVDVSYFDTREAFTSHVPIGKAIDNTQLYILNKQLQPVLNGTQGELYIGGAGLARGYLNRAELTAERFIDNPFVDDAARALGYTRLYKTGDVVRRREDGNIEYLGRNDFQVKIRGYRIELGEIEAVLCEETSVRQAAVIDRARDDGSVYLVAYVVMQEGQTCDSTHLVSQLGAKLPEYMIPSHIVTLSALPLTLNGKLDRRALPAPEIDSEEFVAPRNETEQALCQVWQDVLGLAQVGIEDNFFRLGGDSIVCIQLVSRLRQAGYVCQVKDIFNAPTVAQLSCLLADNMLNGVAQVEAEQGELVGTFDLLPIQQWFFDKALPAPHHWNQAFMVRLPSTVSPQALQAGLEALVARHDMLRCRFIDNKQQYYGMDEVNTELLTLDVSNLDEAQLHQQLTAFQSEFDYQFGPSWCAVHLTGYDDGSARLFMALHHLIVDAVSWRILVDDLSMIMQGHTLPDKTSSYRQWVHALKALEPDTEEIRYWQGVMATPCSLPTAEETIMVDVLQQSSEVTAHLLRDTNEGFNTEINDVLLSAMVLALSETLGEQAYTLGLEGHGREPMDETLDLSRTIGWFTTLYPVRLLGQETVADTLIATKETLRQVPNKGLGFGALRNKGELGGALPTIMFNYLGQFGDGSGQVEDWSLVGEDVGMTSAAGNEDSVLLSVTGAIYEGRLRFKVVSRLSELVHHNFNEAFTSALAAVVAAGCAQAKLGGRKTPSDYGVPTLSAARLQYLQKTHDIEALYPASSLQQGFIYYHLNEPDDDAYRVQVLLDYHCALNIAHYRQAWQMASLRFPSLRVCFDWQDTLVQIVTSGVSLTDEHFSVVDISQLASDVQEQEIERLQQEARMIGFDLSRPGLVRLTIVKRSDTLYTVIKTEHHSISDGWSGPVLGQAVHEYYEALQAGLTCEIKPDQAYLNAQAYQMSRQAQSEAFWQAQKQQYGEANDLRGLFDSSVELADSHLNTAPKEQALELTGNALAQLKNMCRESGTTVNVALQFAWHYLLHGYTQDNQTLVGTTVSGRDLPIEGIESSVGLYINTLPLSVSWDEQQSVEGVLQSIQQSIAMLNSHSAISLAKLQEGGHRLFHSLVVFENYPRTALEGAEGIINQVHFRKSVEKMDYPLTLRAFERDESLVMALCYNGDWLSNKQATRLLSQVMRILTQLPQVERLSQLCLLDEQERTATLLEGNDTQATYPIHGTLVSEFERQVLASPEHIALEMGGVQLSYQQLDAQANQLARELRDRYQQRHRQAMPANTLIGLYMDRSVEMMVAVLAVLKAGGAYVPISPEFPAERTAFILKDTGCPFVLTHAAGTEALQGGLAEQECAAEWLAVEQVMKHTVASDTALPLKAGPEDLAYVIYTSGTTGQPKGVMIAHRAIVNRINWMQKRYPLSSEDKVLQKTPYIFDVSVWELFWAHWAGASLVMAAPDVHRQPEALHTLIEEAGVTTLHFVPSMLAAFCAEMSSEGKVLPRSVKQVFSSGEALQVSHVDAFYGLGQHDAVLHNLYGPTEASVDVSYFDTREAFTSHVPIGKAIDNTQLYILNKQLQPVLNGTQGELYIGGAGLARGYLNRAELTAERFIDNPFVDDAARALGYTRLYKTGDVVRRREDGNIEYLGRNDFQVKIRGYRIELGEIEAVLCEETSVRQAAVIDRARDDGSVYLVAYVVMQEGQTCDSTHLVSQLGAKLPEYMIPSHIVTLSALPLTLNGKLDRRALPAPEIDSEEFVAPRNETEQALCQVWQDVLGLAQVGIEDNFFRLGGDSIVCIQLVSRLRQAGYVCQVKDIFNAPTVAQLSLILQHTESIALLEQAPVEGRTPLLPVQRMFFDENRKNPHHFNQSLLLNVKNGMSESDLHQIVEAILTRHDVFRMRFKDLESGTNFYQELDSAMVCNSVEMIELSSYEYIVSTCEQMQRSLDLQQGPLFKVVCIKLPDGKQKLLILAHHLVIDGVSWRILLRDLQVAVEQIKNGSAPKLAAKTSSYKNWSQFIKHFTKEKGFSSDQEYWLDKLSEYACVSKSNRIYIENSYTKQVRQSTFTLKPLITSRLLGSANDAFRTRPEELMLASLFRACNQGLGLDAVQINLEGHGREMLSKDLDVSETIGWFTTFYPLILINSELDNVESWVKYTKETIRNVPNKGLSFGALSYFSPEEDVREKLQGQVDRSIVFNYLGQFDNVLSDLDSSFSIASESRGQETLEHDTSRSVIFNARIVSKQFEVTAIVFSSDEDANKVELLLTYFQQALLEVVDFCEEVNQRNDLKNKIKNLDLLELESSDSASLIKLEEIIGLEI